MIWIILGVVLGGICLVLAIVFFTGISMYNGLVRLRLAVKNNWAQIDVMLKRRHDLIPNLVETCKGYMKHEREVLENVTKYRSQAMGAKGPAEAGKAEGLLSGALNQVLVAFEKYPDLKANENMMQLQGELRSTEDKIAGSRQIYNNSVMTYNTAIQSFPNNFVATTFHFEAAEFFETPEAEKEVPKVQF
ncbi:MAG: LemA family protein [Planctomycetota bacterium]